MHLDGLTNGPIGLLNIYGPHTAAEHIQLWHSILETIDHARSWIVARDWNFSESAFDQIGGTQEDLSGEEAEVWVTFKSPLRISDIYRPHPDLLTYTWDNHRISTAAAATPMSILKRLDRFYLAEEILQDTCEPPNARYGKCC